MFIFDRTRQTAKKPSVKPLGIPERLWVRARAGYHLNVDARVAIRIPGFEARDEYQLSMSPLEAERLAHALLEAVNRVSKQHTSESGEPIDLIVAEDTARYKPPAASQGDNT